MYTHTSLAKPYEVTRLGRSPGVGSPVGSLVGRAAWTDRVDSLGREGSTEFKHLGSMGRLSMFAEKLATF